MERKNEQKPRIVIYGMGLFGQYIARFAVQKGWPIVAAYNRAGAKVGQDLGRLSGLDRDLGVIVQDCDLAEYGNVEADIGVVTMSNRLSVNFPAYKRLIEAGLNVICLGTESFSPYENDPVIGSEIDKMAREHSVTYTGGGIWDMSRIWPGILVTGSSTEIYSLKHSSLTASTSGGKQGILVTGAGLTVEQFNQQIVNGIPPFPPKTYATVLEQTLVALGYTVTNTNAYIEPVVFDESVDCPLLGREIPAGECVGMRVVGEVDTTEGVTARAEFELRILKEGDVEHMAWSVDGKPRMRIRVEREDAGHAVAACIFNRIPDVIAAPPGIVSVWQMGPPKHTALA